MKNILIICFLLLSYNVFASYEGPTQVYFHPSEWYEYDGCSNGDACGTSGLTVWIRVDGGAFLPVSDMPVHQTRYFDVDLNGTAVGGVVQVPEEDGGAIQINRHTHHGVRFRFDCSLEGHIVEYKFEVTCSSQCDPGMSQVYTAEERQFSPMSPLLNDGLTEDRVCPGSTATFNFANNTVESDEPSNNELLGFRFTIWSLDDTGFDCSNPGAAGSLPSTFYAGTTIQSQVWSYEVPSDMPPGLYRVVCESLFSGCASGEDDAIFTVIESPNIFLVDNNPFSNLGTVCSTDAVQTMDFDWTSIFSDDCDRLYYWDPDGVENWEYSFSYTGAGVDVYTTDGVLLNESSHTPDSGENGSFELHIDEFASSGDLDVSISNQCGVSSWATQLTINTPPTPPGDIFGPSNLCIDEATGVEYSIYRTGNTDFYEWQVMDSGGSGLLDPVFVVNQTSSPEVSFTYDFPSSGYYEVHVTPMNSNGSCGEGETSIHGVYVYDPLTGNQSTSLDATGLANINGTSTYYVDHCSESTSCIDRSLKRANLNVTVDLGEDYDLGDYPFASTFDLTVDVYDSQVGGNVIFTHTESGVEMDNRSVENKLVLDALEWYHQGVRVEVGFTNYTLSSGGQLFEDRIRLMSDIETEYEYDLRTGGVLCTVNAVYDPGIQSMERVFSWNVDGCLVGEVGFEFQLLKLSNEFFGQIPLDPEAPEEVPTIADLNLITTTIDWSDALSLEVPKGVGQLELTLAEGTGIYVYRVRPIGNRYDGGIADYRNHGEWSDHNGYLDGSSVSISNPEMGGSLPTAAHSFYYEQKDRDKNFNYTRVFAEDLKIAETMTYANGLQQPTQQQTLSHSNDVKIVSETITDYEGRPSLQTMAVPIEGQHALGFVHGFVTTGGEEYRAKHFDGNDYQNPSTIDSPFFSYFDGLSAGNVPSAQGYAFTRTRYYNDPTGRTIEQSGVGQTFRMMALYSPLSRTQKNFYSAVADDELVRIFGSEAPDASSVFKTINTDPNGVASVTYTSKQGQVLATCLSTSGPTESLEHLESWDDPSTTFQVTEEINDDVQLGMHTVYASHDFHLTQIPNTEVTVNYEITPAQLSAMCADFCPTCDYEISIHLEATLCAADQVDYSDPLAWPNGAPQLGEIASHTIAGEYLNCGLTAQALAQYSWSTGDMVFNLPPGSYTLYRTVKVSNAVEGSSPQISYLDQMVGDLEATMLSDLSTAPDLNGVTSFSSNIESYIDNNDLQGYLAYIHGMVGSQPEYNTWVLSDPSTQPQEVVIEVIPSCHYVTLPLPSCLVYDCSSADLGNDFYTYFTDYWAGTAYANEQSSQYFLRNYAETDADDDFKTLINNMFNHLYTGVAAYSTVDPLETAWDTDPLVDVESPIWEDYDCQQLWECWIGLTQSYESMIQATNDVNGQLGSPNAAEINIVEDFLNCVGYRIEGYTTNLSEYRTNMYRYVFYDPSVPNLNCEEVAFECGTGCSDNAAFDSNDFLTGTPTGNYASRLAWDSFRQCLSSSVSNNGYNDFAESTEGMQSVCEDLCEERRTAFETAVVKMFRNTYGSNSNPPYILGYDEYELVYSEELGWVPSINPIDPMNPPNATVSTYNEVMCMVNALVANCKGDCELTPQPDSINPTASGTLEQIVSVFEAMNYDFEIQWPGTSPSGSPQCEEGFVDINENAFIPPTFEVNVNQHDWLNLDYDLTNLAGNPQYYIGEEFQDIISGSYQEVVVNTNIDPVSYNSSDQEVSLREAIDIANGNTGQTTWIRFDLDEAIFGTPPYIIQTQSPLPLIVQRIFVNGSSQPNNGDFSGMPRIVINNSVVTNGVGYEPAILNVSNTGHGQLMIDGVEFQVRSHDEPNGITINNASNGGCYVYNCMFNCDPNIGDNAGIFIASYSTPHRVMGNIIGTDRQNQALGFKFAGIRLIKIGDGLIGGYEDGMANLIVNNSVGVHNYQICPETNGDAILKNSIFNCAITAIFNDEAGTSQSNIGTECDQREFLSPVITEANTQIVQGVSMMENTITMMQEPCSFCLIDLYRTYASKQLPEHIGTTITDLNGNWNFNWGEDEPIVYPGDKLIVVSTHNSQVNYTGPEDIEGLAFLEDVYTWRKHHGATSEPSDMVEVDPHACNFPDFCFRWKPYEVPEDITITSLPSCEELAMEAVALSWSQQNYGYITESLEDLEDQYQETCASIDNIDDDFRVSYNLGYHHYTLYYYDRAGNLIRTVAPAGVAYLDPDTQSDVLPDHQYVTDYTYNSLKQLVRQNTPDGHQTEFHYNVLGQLRFSQNAEQAVNTMISGDFEEFGTFSYSRYDDLGRVIEAGHAKRGNATEDLSQQTDLMFNYPPSENTREVVFTTYDELQSVSYMGEAQQYLQNRVSKVLYDEDGDLQSLNDQVTSYYSYDPHGNVKWMAQSLPGVGMKFLSYQYDLVSGNVLEVAYNHGEKDQFFHKYTYDADNRITSVSTSSDGEIWDEDAHYDYYIHGPLKRMELGEDKLQGIDYVYTINGWLKAINHDDLSLSESNTEFGKDAFGMILSYFNGDYQNTHASDIYSLSGLQPQSNQNLYNGNIAAWSTGYDSEISQQVGFEAVSAKFFNYDELNRIRGFAFASGSLNGDGTTNFTSHPAGGYKSAYEYDANGNLLELARNDQTGAELDRLAYYYEIDDVTLRRTNKLRDVVESTPQTAYGSDYEEGGISGDFMYDKIGNLISDPNEGIEKILWTNSGKVSDVIRFDNYTVLDENQNTVYPPNLSFLYGPMGNRIGKIVKPRDASGELPESEWVYTYYVRGPQGNPMAVYKGDSEPNTGPEGGILTTITLSEQSIYGSSRVGQRKLNEELVISELLYAEGSTLPSSLPIGFERQTEDDNLIVGLFEKRTLNHNNGSQYIYEYGGIRGYNVTGTGATQNNGIYANMQEGATSDLNQLVGQDENGLGIVYVKTVEDYNGQANATVIHNRYNFLVEVHQGQEILADPNGRSALMQIPGTNQYWLFTVGLDNRLYKHLVDMDEQGFSPSPSLPFGKVTAVNSEIGAGYDYGHKLLVQEDNREEKLSSLIAQRFNEETGQTELVRFAVDEAGMVLEPSILDEFSVAFAFTDGSMQLSPNGTYLAVEQMREEPMNQFNFSNDIRVYHVGSGFQSVNYMMSHIADDLEGITSFDFSPQSEYLYVSKSTGGPTEFYRVEVLDQSTEELVSQGQGAGDVRRGSNGNMYLFVNNHQTYLEVPQPDDVSPTASTIVGLQGSNNPLPIGDMQITYEYRSGLGMQNHSIISTESSPSLFTRIVGDKSYELNDHLSNVRVVITDVKKATVTTEVLDITTYHAEIVSSQDYYPFGMTMPGRSYTAESYRYGFNGMEGDDEIAGIGSSYGTLFRQYDSRLGRWFSMDPVTFHSESPFAFSHNSPIILNDPKGDCPACLAAAIAEMILYGGAAAVIVVSSYYIAEAITEATLYDQPIYTAPADATATATPPPPTIPLEGIDISDAIPDGVILESESPKPNPSTEPKPDPFPVLFDPNPNPRTDSDNEEKQEYYIHYTSEANYPKIAQSQKLLPNSKNKVYLTKAILTPQQVEDILLGPAKPEDKIGKGEYMFIFKVDADQEAYITKVNEVEYTYNMGTLKIRSGNMVYQGKNVTEELGGNGGN